MRGSVELRCAQAATPGVSLAALASWEAQSWFSQKGNRTGSSGHPWLFLRVAVLQTSCGLVAHGPEPQSPVNNCATRSHLQISGPTRWVPWISPETTARSHLAVIGLDAYLWYRSLMPTAGVAGMGVQGRWAHFWGCCGIADPTSPGGLWQRPRLGRAGPMGNREEWSPLFRSRQHVAPGTQQPENPKVAGAEVAIGWPQVEEVRACLSWVSQVAWVPVIGLLAGFGSQRGTWRSYQLCPREPSSGSCPPACLLPRPWCSCSSGQTWTCYCWPRGRS